MDAHYQATVAELRAHGYVADAEIATALYLADELNKPILIEGEAGVGKTEIAHVLARMKNTELIRLQCYEGLDFNSALYEWNYQKQILSLRLHEAQHDTDIALTDFYSEEYLSYRPISRAMMADRRVVLLLDEVDRADGSSRPCCSKPWLSISSRSRNLVPSRRSTFPTLFSPRTGRAN